MPTRAQRHDVRASMSATGLGPLRLVYAATTGAETTMDFDRPESDYVVSFEIRGRQQVTIGLEQITAMDEAAVIISRGKRAKAHTSGHCALLHIAIDRHALDRHLE